MPVAVQATASPSTRGIGYVCHSGGVQGADTCWQRVGAEYQVATKAYRPFDDPALDNPCSVPLDQQQLLQADALLAQAAKLLGVDLEALPPKERNYIRKNYFQVEPAEAVFAVARIIDRGLLGGGEQSLAGGTAWAYHMAIICHKPVFVFDDEADWRALQEGCFSCSKQWHTYDYSTQRLVPIPGPPALPRSFGGIGTRELSAAGRAAVAEVYHKTFGQG